ncbi:hypothetical protein GCM10027168_16630 [Streptomyces capparidis]
MATTDWFRLLEDPAEAVALFGSAPDLSGCDLFRLHVDERGTAAALGFRRRGLPERPPRDWAERRLNAIEFHLVFTGVTELAIDGWTTAPARTALTPGGSGGIGVRLTAAGGSVRFRAAAMALRRPRAFLAGESP